MKEGDVNALARGYRRVLVPLDGLPLGESIIPFIRDIAGPWTSCCCAWCRL
jgi:hypothetical protein